MTLRLYHFFIPLSFLMVLCSVWAVTRIDAKSLLLSSILGGIHHREVEYIFPNSLSTCSNSTVIVLDWGLC
jgi:hypothetical protein